MRVAVTGAAGLIGGVVYDRLLADGHEVVGIDRPNDEWFAAGRNTDDATAPSRVTHHFDLAEASDSDWHMMLEDCEVVVHLAADANPSIFPLTKSSKPFAIDESGFCLNAFVGWSPISIT